ncbi:FAD/NAD(P)-binding domain-containing protein [Boletus reticuloceps]|uniref:FAD/NAD(P)-binding domain-containing protein n=1 Tax=Boletus reticuloceps TaxID=495285 RepID=A0A8I2YFH8_9AGAM|nr:FAD/NAD(P)-binding domain-containing protein [Boletus reticuloceps]
MATSPRRVLIIGGGPCGLVTLRNLLERGEFEDVQLVERRDNIGGVWYQSRNEHANDDSDPLAASRSRWPTPAYPALIGNVIPEFLSLSGYPFPTPPREGQPFPTLRETYDYIAAFARPLFERGKIRLHHEVVDVAEIEAEDGGGWRVAMTDWSKGSGSGVSLKEERWDAVVITTVWYDNAYYPDVEGLDDVKLTGRVLHAQTWRGPSGYEGKHVVIIGNANSANEMAAQLVPVAQLPVYRSTRRVSIFPSLPDDCIEDVGPVSRYSRGANGKITVHLQDRTIDDVDYVLFGTGYYPDVPYLRVLGPAVGTSDRARRSLDRLTHRHIQPIRVPSLYRHVLYAHNTSLAFIGALISFTPFAMADLTSTWLALAWSSPAGTGTGTGTRTGSKVTVPPTVASRLADEQDRLQILHQLRSETDNPSDLVSFHFLGRYELPYAQVARAEIVRAAPELGDVLAPWDDAQDARRFAMYATKLDSLYVLAGKTGEP